MLHSIVEAPAFADVYQDREVEIIQIPQGSFNEDNTIDLTQFPNLKKLHVGSGSLQNVKTLVLKGLESLDTVVIRDGCFLSCRRTVFESRFALSPE